MDTEKRKLQMKEEISKKESGIDAKLDKFAKNLDNEEMKKKLNNLKMNYRIYKKCISSLFNKRAFFQ